MGIRDRLDRALGLGPSDEPRPVAVAARTVAKVRPVVSTPGARVHVTRDGWDPDTSNVLLMCQRLGVAVELAEGPTAFRLDGQVLSAEALRAALS